MGNDDNGNFNPKTSSGTDARINSNGGQGRWGHFLPNSKLAPNMKPMKANDTKRERQRAEGKPNTTL